MLKLIGEIFKILAGAGLGYALFAIGGLSIGLGVQMTSWLLVVLGIAMVLYGFLLVGL